MRARCVSLHEFVKEAWSVLEPDHRFSDNWHIGLICAHLEAVTRGEINRLLINVWPGSMKSLITSVFWPAWEWGPAAKLSYRYISTSFNELAVTRDTRKTRDLLLSEWYRTLWPEVELRRTAETSFDNTRTGSRTGVAFGSLTAQRGDRLIIDDPHSVLGGESEVERNNTTRKFREGAVNRLNDQERSAIVIIMQRIHQQDISGVIESQRLGYVHVVLPMEFEVERAYRSRWGNDPRTKEGELADLARFPPAAVEGLKQSGEYFWASQYQQRPAPREGGVFKIPEDWAVQLVVDLPPVGGETVSGWDFAASTKSTSPYTVRVQMTRSPDGMIYIRDVQRRRTSPQGLNLMVEELVEADGFHSFQDMPQDPGQAGKVQKSELATRLEGYLFRITPETGDKELRALPFAAQLEAGKVRLVRGEWNSAYIEELRNFPAGQYKDQVDASSRAYAGLLTRRPAQETGTPEVVDLSAPSPSDPRERLKVRSSPAQTRAAQVEAWGPD